MTDATKNLSYLTSTSVMDRMESIHYAGGAEAPLKPVIALHADASTPRLTILPTAQHLLKLRYASRFRCVARPRNMRRQPSNINALYRTHRAPLPPRFHLRFFSFACLLHPFTL